MLYGMSEADMTDLWEELYETYQAALITLSGSGNNNPTDAQVVSTMLGADNLQTVRDLQRDFTILRWPSRF